MKKRIGLDLDSTLVHLPVISTIAKELGDSYDDTIPHNWTFDPLPPIYFKRAKELFKIPEFMCNLTPYPGVAEKLESWKIAGHELILITARSENIRLETVAMVNRLFPSIGTIDFVSIGETKKPLFEKYKLDLWIDDSPHETRNALSLGIKSYLVSNHYTTYNYTLRDEHHENLTVVSSVVDINF